MFHPPRQCKRSTFWSSLEKALEGIKAQLRSEEVRMVMDALRSEEVRMVMDALRNTKAFLATVSFIADLGGSLFFSFEIDEADGYWQSTSATD